MINHFYAVIMAGGGGTRLWPLSRAAKPKQLLSLASERSLFQISIDRIRETFPPENIYVVASHSMSLLLKEQAPEIPVHNFVIEPSARGTASAIGLAAAVIKKIDPHCNATMAVLTADHMIQNEQYFNDLLEACFTAAQSKNLITIGIQPSFPATGYGYIQTGEDLIQLDGFKLFKAARFKEKPAIEQAQLMVADGSYVWNSGMFVWEVDTILDAFNAYMPALSRVLALVQSPQSDGFESNDFVMQWNKLEKQTIDYGIMEKAQNVSVIPAHSLGWSDVGSWDSLFEVLPSDKDGNIILSGDHINVNSTNTLVYTSHPNKVIATINIKDLVIVDTGDALLICPRDSAQYVKKITDQLKENNREGYL